MAEEHTEQDIQVLSPAELVSQYDVNICAPMVRYR